MMGKFPDAGYGLCTIPPLVERPFPIRLLPREAYRHHYFRSPIFHRAPLSSIIARSAWEAVGGFAPERMTGDMDMWHRLSKMFPVVLMPPGIIWYREHPEQEAVKQRQDEIYWSLRYQAITQRALVDPDVPLTPQERKEIARQFAATTGAVPHG